MKEGMSVRGAALLAMASQMGAFVIQFAASVVLARWFIDPDELGLFTIAFSFVSLLAVLQEFGINRYVAGEPDLDEDGIRTAFSVSLAISWAIALLCVVLSWPAAAFYDLPGLLPLLLVVAASYFFVPLATVPMALLHRAMDFRSNTMIEIGVVLANAAVAISLAWQGYGAIALAWGAFAQQVARAAKVMHALRATIVSEFQVIPRNIVSQFDPSSSGPYSLARTLANQVDAKNVWVKAGRVEVKGRHKREIAQWLESKGF